MRRITQWCVCQSYAILSPVEGAENIGKTADSQERAASGAATSAENVPGDPNLAMLIEVWPTLPEPVKAGILAMVRAAGGK